MTDIANLIKSLVRPFIIFWGFLVYGIVIMVGEEAPVLLVGLVTAVIVEYFGERAIKRLKEK
ncbi:unnamed protein product [marine sediment metagenome]|uniref:Uncharacterized protein n=1 Tax=marine sediment metagenome TaxID=412755 RepID=X0Z5I0_9ZZZZ